MTAEEYYWHYEEEISPLYTEHLKFSESYANHQTSSLREELEKVRDHAVTLTNEKEELEAKIEKAAAEGYSFGRADAETEIEDSLREEIERLKKQSDQLCDASDAWETRYNLMCKSAKQLQKENQQLKDRYHAKELDFTPCAFLTRRISIDEVKQRMKGEITGLPDTQEIPGELVVVLKNYKQE